MSVYVSDFVSSTEWIVMHDEVGHTATIAPSEVTYSLNLDGSHNHNFASLMCPVCGAVSTHPVGGGAQPPLVQQMFVQLITLGGCACGNVEAGNATLADSHAHLNCDRMDGPERWQL